MAPTAPAAMVINIVPGAGLSSNSAALSAFQRAAQGWSNIFTDNITVNINADLASLGAGILGSTSTSLIGFSYSAVRSAMIADGAGDANGQILNSLPATLSVASLPAGFTASPTMALTLANAKALGLTSSTGTDASITFSSNFGFDYDNSNGVGAGLYDFQTVAAHEIGHALGFVSSVDTVDTATAGRTINLNPLDLFRFVAGSAPLTSGDFATATRDLFPGHATVFSDTVSQYLFSTGAVQGDGHQASHWKDDALTGINIGIMDPSLAAGVVATITSADRRAFDLIGYNLVSVPEPSTLILVVGALCLLLLGKVRLPRRDIPRRH